MSNPPPPNFNVGCGIATEQVYPNIEIWGVGEAAKNFANSPHEANALKLVCGCGLPQKFQPVIEADKPGTQQRHTKTLHTRTSFQIARSLKTEKVNFRRGIFTSSPSESECLN